MKDCHGTNGNGDLQVEMQFSTEQAISGSSTEMVRIDSDGRLLANQLPEKYQWLQIRFTADVHNGSDTANIFGVTGADQTSEYLVKEF